MTLFGGPSAPLLLQRHFPPVKLTGRCFLLRPRRSTTAAVQSGGAVFPEVECVELTQSDVPTPRQQRSIPGSLVGNSYYTQRYNSGRSMGRRVATAAASSPSPRFLTGDVVLRLCRSAVPRELAHKRIVDVTGLQTSFLNSSERDRRTFATVEEALETMHLHDGHEVPALQRGDVDLVRLRPQCVYAPPPATVLKRTSSHGKTTVSAATATPSFDLTNLPSVLWPLDNPDILLAQSRRLTFRSEMEALQVARVLAASVSALNGGSRSRDSMAQAEAMLRPVVRDGHLISVVLRLPHRAH